MTFFLTKSDFEFLNKKMPHTCKLVKNIHKHTDNVYFDIEDILEFQVEMNGEIVDNGIDNEDTVNKNGIRMYHIYDEILYQKHNTV